MLTFNPASLEQSLRRQVEQLELLDCSVEIFGVTIDADFDPAEFTDATACEDTDITLSVPRSDELIEVSLRRFGELCDEVNEKGIEFDGLVFRSCRRTVERVEPIDARADLILQKLREQAGGSAPVLSVSVASGGQDHQVGIVFGDPGFCLALLTKKSFYDDYFPPFDDREPFIQVLHAAPITRQLSDEIIQAYLFELSSSHDLRLQPSPRPDDYSSDEEDPDNARTPSALRPLLIGAGLAPLLRDFNRGVITDDSDIALLCFVKCVEYVSATVVRAKQYEDMRRRLLTPGAIDPNAEFIDGLLALFEENRTFLKDAEALRLAIEKCCDGSDLAAVAPACLPILRSLKATAKPQERTSALRELAGCLTATRNQIAHAKPNFELTGKECPDDQLKDLVTCARVSAVQCIRWFADQNPSFRRR